MATRHSLALALLFPVLGAHSLAQLSDSCGSAGTLGVGLTAMDSTMATTDGLPLNPAICDMGVAGDEQIHNDLWGTFTPPTTENYHITTAGLANFDTRIAVYDSPACPDSPLNVIACNDNEDGPPPFQAGVTVLLTAGVTYKVRVGSAEATTLALPGQLNIGPVGNAPLNDECEDAITVTEGVTFFNNSGASTTGSSLNPMVCDMGDFGDEQIYFDIWYQFVPRVTKSYEVTTFGLAGFDTRIAVYSQDTCPDDPQMVVACNDDAFGFPFEAGLTTNLVAGTVYTIRIGNFDPLTPGAAGSFYVGDPGGPQPPANDDCANAESLIAGSNAVNTTQATDGVGQALDPSVCDLGPFGDEQIYRDVWFHFTPNLTSTWVISSVNTGGFDSRLALYDQTSCPDDPNLVLACNDDQPGTFESEIQVGLIAGASYLVRYGSYDDSTFGVPGFLVVDLLPPPSTPDNDACENATMLASAFGTTAYDASGATTDGAASDGLCDYGSFGDEQNYNDVWFTYSPVSTGCVYISTLGLTAVDTRLSVYEGSNCPDDPATMIACVDEEILPLTAPFNAGLDVTLLAGGTYLIRLGTYGPGVPNGPGSLKVDLGPQAIAGSGGVNPGAPGCGPAPQFPNFCNGDGGDQLGCTDCPCMNNAPAGTVGGCLNSSGTSARLIASGDTSVSLPPDSISDLRFGLTGALPSSFCILNSGAGVAPQNAANPCFGTNSGIQSMLFDGLRCAIQSNQRHGGRPSDMNGSVGVNTNSWGGASGPADGLAVAFGGFAAGQVRYWQVIHRELPNLSCMRALNTSQAVQVTFTP